MAPSRGILIAFNRRTFNGIKQRWPSPSLISLPQRQRYSSRPTVFAAAASHESSIHQIYISRSLNPYLNLSIEHFLLQKTPASSKVLFLYTNRPSVIIGRNQNPWLEVNLRLLDAARAQRPGQALETEPPSIGDVSLVRRRSGGGTVFHDTGNVNYCVISPSSEFTRDKHAEMVVRAMRKLGVDRARVNERHDIVLDQGPLRDQADHTDMHKTPYMWESRDIPQPLKVSGSAYKLTRQRALHHGTCLLSSPNLHIMPHYLHSPAKPYIKARGVESVNSPVGNVGIANGDFENAVVREFALLYNLPNEAILGLNENAGLRSGDEWVSGVFDETYSEVPSIRTGMAELKSPEWTFMQTPQFTFSSHSSEEDSRDRPAISDSLPPSTHVHLKARSGVISESRISTRGDKKEAEGQAEMVDELLTKRKIHELADWSDLLRQSQAFEEYEASPLSKWLNCMFGK
ncbi:MAG: hypothetical protein M1819_001076 [Sarea resinae]|nr:MAG: hypothetical protein M1819_001076 [Sarea resinae]